MKKRNKKILGFLGLVLVAVMTVFAASLPTPEVLAASSVTDTIVVRVLSGAPDVNITKPSSGDILVNPSQTINIDFANVDYYTVTLEVTDIDGHTTTYNLYDDYSLDYEPGTNSLPINLYDYGYGDYVVTIHGGITDGVSDDDTVSFSFVPVKATVEEDEKIGEPVAMLEYDTDSTDFDHFEINVYDKNGELVDKLSPITVKRPDTKVILPFEEYGIPAGTYTVTIAAYDINGEMFYETYEVVYEYSPSKAPIDVPDTGGLFQSMNISKADYLATGLLIFSIVGIGGIVFIAKGRKNSKRK